MREAAAARSPNGHFINQWPFYQGPNGHFIKASPVRWSRKGQPSGLAFGGPIRYCAAQAVYQRLAGHGFDQGRPRWPVYQGRISSLSTAGQGPGVATLSRTAKPQWQLYQPMKESRASPPRILGFRVIFLRDEERRMPGPRALASTEPSTAAAATCLRLARTAVASLRSTLYSGGSTFSLGFRASLVGVREVSFTAHRSGFSHPKKPPSTKAFRV